MGQRRRRNARRRRGFYLRRRWLATLERLRTHACRGLRLGLSSPAATTSGVGVRTVAVVQQRLERRGAGAVRHVLADTGSRGPLRRRRRRRDVPGVRGTGAGGAVKRRHGHRGHARHGHSIENAEAILEPFSLRVGPQRRLNPLHALQPTADHGDGARQRRQQRRLRLDRLLLHEIDATKSWIAVASFGPVKTKGNVACRVGRLFALRPVRRNLVVPPERRVVRRIVLPVRAAAPRGRRVAVVVKARPRRSSHRATGPCWGRGQACSRAALLGARSTARKMRGGTSNGRRCGRGRLSLEAEVDGLSSTWRGGDPSTPQHGVRETRRSGGTLVRVSGARVGHRHSP